MHYSFRSVLTSLLLVFAMASSSYAQDDSAVISVAYIEVKPSLTEQAVGLLQAHAENSRAHDGNLRFQVLQRIGRPNHFAILDAWVSRELQAGNAAATEEFRDALDAMLYSPYDERKSIPALGTSASGNDGDIYVLTHIDFAPRGLEKGMEAVASLVAASRQESGAEDIGLIVQDNRQNHMTLFEVWSSKAVHEAHVTSQHAMQARDQMQALIGALYDERLYRRL